MKDSKQTKKPKFQLNDLQIRLFNTPEGKLLAIGLLLAFTLLGWVSLLALWDPGTSHNVTGMIATHILFGRAAGMSFGYVLGLSHFLVIAVNFILESTLVFIFYPLFVFSWQRLLVFDFLNNFMKRIQRSAEANQDFIRKYGVLGLLLFVWFPFWMTGPLVGSIIAFLLGLRLWLNLSVVLSGTAIAILCWAMLLREFHDRVAVYSPYAPLVLAGFLILIVFAGHFLTKTRHKDDS